MRSKSNLGEFEQMVLLAILQTGDEAFGLEVRREIEQSTARRVSRGAFYTTLDRLETKGLVTWKERPATGPRSTRTGSRRGGMKKRHFKVTASGLRALRASRAALRNLWRGLDAVLKER